MADFTGLCVKVTLKEPANAQVHGQVKNVVPGQTMALRDAILPNGLHQSHYMIPSGAIADLQVVDASTLTVLLAVAKTTTSHSAVTPQARLPLIHREPPARSPPRASSLRQQSAFVDPAILSYGKSPAQGRTATDESARGHLPPGTPTDAPRQGPLHNARPLVIARPAPAPAAKVETTSSPPKVAAPQQASGLGAADGAHDGSREQGSTPRKGARKKTRRGQTQIQPPPASPALHPAVIDAEVSRNGHDMEGSAKRGRGWRQTPLLQPTPQTTTPAAPTSKKQQIRPADPSQQSGWATEDATDVQDMDDFDFEANHKLFDKKSVFDQLRQDDTTADQDRLVSHNKLHARPGTHGGKNLHPTEYVLSPHLELKHDSNDLDSTTDADNEPNLASLMTANGRSSSRHSSSKGSVPRKAPMRQSSAQTNGRPHPLAASMSSERNMTASIASLASRGSRPGPLESSYSPIPDRIASPQSAVSSARRFAAPHLPSMQGPAFVVMPAQTVCPILHPGALETLEQITMSKYALTEEAIAEAAARCIAETAVSMVEQTNASRRGSRADTLRGSMTASTTLGSAASPVVVVLVGNHAVGGRALAASRHLVSRNFHLIIAHALPSSPEQHIAQLRTQKSIIRRMTGAGAGIQRGWWRQMMRHIKDLPAPPAIIIDALLAGTTYESACYPEYAALLQPQTTQEIREMIDWANRSRAPVLSVGCPSGVSSVDGRTTLVDGEPLAVRPDKVLALGTPTQGLLEATKGGERWDVRLADLGLNIALLSDEQVVFGNKWVVELRYVEGQGDSEPAEGVLP